MTNVLWRTTWILSGAMLLSLASQLTADAAHARGHGKSIYSTTGAITEIRKNRIIIEEDGSHARMKFYYMRRDISQFSIGERVRVYYRDIRRPVVSIKKLTELKYDEKRQNMGYVTGKPQ